MLKLINFVGSRTSIQSIRNEKTDAVREIRRGGENTNTRFKGKIHAHLNGEGVDKQNIPHRHKKTDLYSSEANPDSLEADPSDLQYPLLSGTSFRKILPATLPISNFFGNF